LVVAFLLIFDVAGALLVELVVLPRKKAGVYDDRSRNVLDYIGRLVPFRSQDRAAYAGVGSAYWLAVLAIASTLVAMIIGFVNLWVRAFGPSIFGGYMNWLGLDAAGFLGATLDPHSHMIAIAIIGLIVALAARRFGVFDGGSSLRRTVARVGTSLTAVGIVLTTLVLGAVAFLNFAPPDLFTSGPDGVNGVAGDDVIMAIVFVGAMVVAVAMAADRRFRHDGLRLTIAGSWVAMVVVTMLEGFYIELNHDRFGGSLATNDAAFSAAHPMTGLFLMIAVSVALLLVDYYQVAGRARQVAIGLGAVGIVAAVTGTTLWTFVDPSNTGASYAIYIASIALVYLTVLVAGAVVRSVQTRGFDRTDAVKMGA